MLATARSIHFVHDGVSDLLYGLLPLWASDFGLTVAQVGACIVTYAGRENSWVRRTYRRDLRLELPDPVDDVLAALGRREHRSSDTQGRYDQLSLLGRRGGTRSP